MAGPHMEGVQDPWGDWGGDSRSRPWAGPGGGPGGRSRGPVRGPDWGISGAGPGEGRSGGPVRGAGPGTGLGILGAGPGGGRSGGPVRGAGPDLPQPIEAGFGFVLGKVDLPIEAGTIRRRDVEAVPSQADRTQTLLTRFKAEREG